MATSNGTETTPLMHTTSSPKPYYFLSGGRRESIDESYESRPVGSTNEDFASRPVMVSFISQSWI